MGRRLKLRRVTAAALVASILLGLLSGCAGERGGESSPTPSAEARLTRYEVTYLDLFDTVTVLKGYAGSQEEFGAVSRDLYDRLLLYHRLCDIYNDYPGVNNLKTVNDSAGGEPVTVDRELFDLLLFCRDLSGLTSGTVDVTLGPVLALWHEKREEGIADPDHAALPDEDALKEAYTHVGWDGVELDEAASTVRLTDPAARLDVGAVAKGYAVERLAELAPPGYLISVGGNVRATGPKPDGSDWVVGVQDPDGGSSDFLHTVSLTSGSVVTSGDYQRYYTVDGVRYHHIIDPATLYPSVRWRGVTILCKDSGLADGLSTALFILDREEGEALVRRMGAEALWAAADGSLFYTDGFLARVKS